MFQRHALSSHALTCALMMFEAAMRAAWAQRWFEARKARVAISGRSRVDTRRSSQICASGGTRVTRPTSAQTGMDRALPPPARARAGLLLTRPAARLRAPTRSSVAEVRLPPAVCGAGRAPTSAGVLSALMRENLLSVDW